MLVYAITLIIIGFCVFFSTGKLIMAWQSAIETKSQIEMMNKYITDYNEKTKKINSEPYRAIKIELIDDVQTNLIFSIKAHQLNLISFKNMTPQNEKAEKVSNGKEFEINFEGSWVDTVKFLSNFHIKDTLIAILNLRMEPNKDGSVKTSLHYKIYTR